MITLVIGAPGTGKTYKIKEIKRKIPSAIVFCPTNSSAQLCDGQTVFKWFGCTPFDIDQAPNKFFPKNQLIIFDEIFMFSSQIFDKVLAAKPSKIVCFGDPFQIHQSNQTYWYENIDISQVKVKYLTKYYRATDPKLQQLLTEYRLTKQIPQQLPFEKINEKLVGQYIKQGYTLLVGKKSAIKYYAKQFLYDFRDLSGTWWYEGQRVMTINQYGNCQQITTIKNYSDGVFELESGELVKPRKKERADIITVNLAQGQTLDGVLIDFGSFFEFGSAYTAISRAKSCDKIKIVTWPVEIMEADLTCEFVW